MCVYDFLSMHFFEDNYCNIGLLSNKFAAEFYLHSNILYWNPFGQSQDYDREEIVVDLLKKRCQVSKNSSALSTKGQQKGSIAEGIGNQLLVLSFKRFFIRALKFSQKW